MDEFSYLNSFLSISFFLQRTRPPVSFSLCIFLALKNSRHGVLPPNEIYKWMLFNFPYLMRDCLENKSSIRKTIKSKMLQDYEKVFHPSKRFEIDVADKPHQKRTVKSGIDLYLVSELIRSRLF